MFLPLQNSFVSILCSKKDLLSWLVEDVWNSFWNGGSKIHKVSQIQ